MKSAMPPQRPLLMFVPICWRHPIGGSDIHLLALARHLAASSRVRVEIASTAPPGTAPMTTRDGAIPVREFRATDPAPWSVLARRLVSRLPPLRRLLERAGWRAPAQASPDLIAYLHQCRADIRAVVTGPYLFGIPADIVAAMPERSVLLPCLHDEAEAYFAPASRTMRGAALRIFNTVPERALAERLYGKQASGPIIGCGIDPAPTGTAEPDLRRRHGITGDYLIHLGRQSRAKRVPALVAEVARHNRRHPQEAITLVLAGDGPYRPRPRPWLRRVGPIDTDSKFGLLRHALANITLSRLESLSLTVLEGWSTGTPAIVAADSAVLRWQIDQSGAGLTVGAQRSLTHALRQMRDPVTRARLGRAGQAFVADTFHPDRVTERFLAALSRPEEITESDATDPMSGATCLPAAPSRRTGR